jgi:CTP:molybdopterin cytidylyltransferase MocA
MTPVPPVFAVVLAAGSAQRFGGQKLLEPVNGRPLLAHVIRAVQVCEREGVIRASYVVVPSLNAGVAELVREMGARAVVAAQAADGMGWSLRAGLEAVEAAAPIGGAALVVVLGDQPGLRPDVTTALVRRWRAGGGPVVRPRYADEPDVPGHPVLLDRSEWVRLAALEGDRGLGDGAMGTAVLVDAPGRNPDIDTRADARAFSRREAT